jgi:hypothetical protein
VLSMPGVIAEATICPAGRKRLKASSIPGSYAKYLRSLFAATLVPEVDSTPICDPLKIEATSGIAQPS